MLARLEQLNDGFELRHGVRLAVRIGVHTCEATVSGDNYVGIGVHRSIKASLDPENLFNPGSMFALRD